MQTIKLRTLQQPTGIALLLDSLVMSQIWVPVGAPQVMDRCDLPSALQKLAVKAVREGGTWRAWLGHDGVRFFISEMSLELSRERGCAALKVRYYNEQGELQMYSQWVRIADGATWQRCTL
ncbi:MAG: hypothetical protein M3N50_02470 [Pseudomonadota bacterium]|nr:hypothetical protein [Pseudomonadota bacterium]